ncbi:MAG: phosphatase PAP2 family protein [Candidatus Nomurabacteria bacterium]|nr:MAG: phosphatase PAP2 family protein [Candidatus Nomurabacteria bacterium]
MRRAIHAFDRVVGHWITDLPSWMHPVMHLFSWIGEPPVTVGVAAIAFGYGFALDKPLYETAGIIAFVTIAFGSLLKLVLRRRRPITDYSKNMFIKTFSFPSGHAAGSLVSFIMAALIIGNRWPELTIAAWAVALVVCFMIGVSRVYLGAHYVSDIIGGWIIGVIGLAFVIDMFI